MTTFRSGDRVRCVKPNCTCGGTAGVVKEVSPIVARVLFDDRTYPISMAIVSLAYADVDAHLAALEREWASL